MILAANGPPVPPAGFKPPDVARGFNEGSHARLRGLGYHRCPYTDEDREMRYAWQRGWRDCNYYWGVHVLGRWRYPELPLAR